MPASRLLDASRRCFAPALLLAVMAAGAPCVTAAPQLDRALLATRIEAIAHDVDPARLGVAVLVPATGERWSLAGKDAFPMQSVFMAPLGAMMLDEVDHGWLRLDSTLVLTEKDLSVPYSAVNDSFPARTRYTVDDLLTLAVGSGDNTAADLLLGLVGGPRALTAWLKSRGLNGIRVDRFQRELQPASLGLGAFRAEWSDHDAFTQAVDELPEFARREALERHLSGKLDTLTPEGAVAFLDTLQSGRLLSPASTARLLRIMTETTTGAGRLKNGLPEDATLAHKAGTGETVLGVNTACNDIGLVTLPDGRTFVIAVLLSGSTADAGVRDSVLAAVARAVVEAME
jgi:beta-lactamase class A